jgi:enoyl-[acyl-carrier protein] reductase/trans-2-enoyl-CoA reductase (NAD+)
MIIKPSIRSNFFTNAHPLGCKKNLKSQIDEVLTNGSYTGPKNVLIIGGSSGYGLSSRISVAFGGNANTVNVSFESSPRGKRTGSAGYWNNAFFQYFAKDTNRIHKDFIGDAFSTSMKEQVSAFIKKELGSVDLVVYSLASGARKNEKTGETIRSHIKPLGKAVKGKTIDLAKMEIVELEIKPGTDQEIKDTVFVMGGSDWQDWIYFLKEQQLLSEGCKTIAYTYVGTETTADIYRNGTMGKAKEDLELKARLMNDMLQKELHGEALISSSKAIVSKASVFIPQMPIYVSCLFHVMTKEHIHESTTMHKHRLFKDMVYGDKRLTDDLRRLRLDSFEMQPHIQQQVHDLMSFVTDQSVFDLNGTKMFLKEFYQINGFNVDGIDYDKDVNLEDLLQQYPIK